ncbi:MAG: aminoglycoside phosphotransferase [Dermatophilaceae bacterium]
MTGPLLPLPPSFLDLLPPWVARQRWYAGKGRVPALRRIGVLMLADPTGAAEIEVHLLLDESALVPTTYQVPLTSRRAPLPGAEHALVGMVEPDGPDARYIYDAPHDPVYAAALLRLMLDEGTTAPDRSTGSAVATGHQVAKSDPGQLRGSHVLTGEQSNTSVILDLVDDLDAPSNPLICKVFRVLHHGENPDIVVQSALAVAGSKRVPDPVGNISGQWPDASAPGGMARGHLAFAQEFFPGVDDAWRVALEAVKAGTHFEEPARSLGLATAEVHAALAQTMGTRSATDEDVASLTRSMTSRHAAAVSEVPALADFDSMIEASIESVSSASWPALQRIHGDYHLGQVLDVPDRGWVLVDFEGEPLRPLGERTGPDLALRDVAGMLRSFDYVAGSWEQLRPGASASAWATNAREAFLDGYAEGGAHDPREDRALLNALELDKALYEVVYEARNRPTWLGIPTTAIARLAAGTRSDLRP